jgi:feruloyl esterase
MLETCRSVSNARRDSRVMVSRCAVRAAQLLAVVMYGMTASAAQAQAPKTSPSSCESLAGLALPNVKIVSAVAIAAGEFSPGAPLPPTKVPAFCRVSATLTPSPDSDIQIELWLPTAWNGKYLANGVGGWGGAIPYPGLMSALQRGYATSGTDTGHRGNMGAADFALDHPEKVKDFAWRAIHEMTVQSKSIIKDYYGKPDRLAYFSGCSAGGKQGLMEVQKFPADFDGVVAGAPAADWIGLNSSSLYDSLLNIPKGGHPIIGPAQGQLIHQAVIAQCDKLDGLADGEVADPRVCGFKASSLICRAGQAPETCLTPEQAAVADKFYQAVRDPKDGSLVFPGMLPSSELGWGMVPVPMPPAVGEYQFVVRGDAHWDPYTFDLSRDVAEARRTDIISALNPDLSAFAARHGKLIQYHGLSDPIIPTEASINYYESVASRQNGLNKTDAFYRLFLVPGMGHCMGAYDADWVDALDQWVEHGKAPRQVLGHRLPPMTGPPPMGPPPMVAPEYTGTRPICAYPAIAKYDGVGPADAATSFSCRAAPRGVRDGDGPITIKSTG